MKLAFDLRYALRSLRRDGTRTFLAGLCVAFGVLSLVAMQLLTVTLLEGLMFDMRLYYGGDAQVRTGGERQTFQPADLEQIKTWQEQGLIAGYTPTAYQDEPFLRTKTSGRVSL